MSNLATQRQARLPQTRVEKLWINIKKNWQLHAMIILPFLYMALFSYVPMYGVQIAFKKYSPRAGIWGSPWIGLQNIEKFFGYYMWEQVVFNTLALTTYSIVVGFPIPIIMALIIHVNTGKHLKKITQRISYVPHFISVVVLVGMINTILNPVFGAMSYIIRIFDIQGYVDIRGNKDAFRHLYMWSGEWQAFGWSSIIYVSGLSSVSDELHEAAKIDGASRLRRIWNIDIPSIAPMAAMLFIMSTGSLLSVGYQKIWLMQNAMNHEVSEVISTYVYKNGIRAGDSGFGTAVGLFQAVINTILLMVVNKVAGWLSDGQYGMF